MVDNIVMMEVVLDVRAVGGSGRSPMKRRTVTQSANAAYNKLTLVTKLTSVLNKHEPRSIHTKNELSLFIVLFISYSKTSHH